MVTALVWNDAKSFRQHLEDMRVFRQSHHRNLESRPALKDMPNACDTPLPGKTGGARGFISARGKLALIPMWEIVPPSNSQN
jgi:hypothetical protein